jgi:hypothetical protein
LSVPEHCRPSQTTSTCQQQAESLLPFYTRNEFAQHNDVTDAWTCLFAAIYDITTLIEKVQGTPIHQQLISYAGEDLSSLFDETTHQPRQRIDSRTGQSVSVIANVEMIGHLNMCPRYVQLLHSFAPQQIYCLPVDERETVGQIALKFLQHNAHCFSYRWRYDGRVLDFDRTLSENGLINEEHDHERFAWRADGDNCPRIVLEFADDLTVA